MKRLPIVFEDIEGKILAHNVVDAKSGEVIASCNEPVDEKLLEDILASNASGFQIVYIDNVSTSDSISKVLISSTF